jgi:hypothetical protein
MGKRCDQSVCIWSLIFKKPAEYRNFAKTFVTFEILLVERCTLKCNFIYEENNQQNALIVSLINLLIYNYSNMFRPLS